MARKPKLLEAKFDQVLLYLDVPQVILLSAIADSKVIAVAIKEYPDYEYPFFAAQVSTSQFMDYMAEKFDLRYILLKPDMKRNFVFDLSLMEDGMVSLVREKISSDNIEKYLPDAGLFAREHTEDLSVTIRLPQAEQKFGVDGSWDLPEFSYFYSNVTDLYTVFNSIDMFLDKHTALNKKTQITNSFIKPFQGGGSYRGFYGSLLDAHTKENRLRVGGISYHSPGYVTLKGYPKPFSEIKNLIANFEANYTNIYDRYHDLNGILSKAKLLRAPAENFNNNTSMARTISDHSKLLAEVLDVVEYNAILSMAGHNILICAKVLLSIYRRASRLYEFFLEGRVSLDIPTSMA